MDVGLPLFRMIWSRVCRLNERAFLVLRGVGAGAVLAKGYALAYSFESVSISDFNPPNLLYHPG